ncbi:NUDIX hydrolase [Amycolatopsis sp. A1MSW2902]|uniref:NUDIX hydrolase n=1 Tax=Amycolatopsis sp. A1MSW2902 TaxID=687413 RepID=UPI00307D1730
MDDWRPPDVMITVDLVALTIRDDVLHVLLVERGVEPFRGRLALPGGFVQKDEALQDAAVRELEEETHIPVNLLHLEQLGTYGNPGRDPRGRVITVVYLAVAPDLPAPVGDTDAAAARWVPLSVGMPLAFDHERILQDGVERARAKLEYTTIAAAFCAERFTMGDLRRVYEIVWGVRLDPRNFQRKVLNTESFVVSVNEVRRQDSGRPAQLYMRGRARLLYPSILRSQ